MLKNKGKERALRNKWAVRFEQSNRLQISSRSDLKELQVQSAPLYFNTSAFNDFDQFAANPTENQIHGACQTDSGMIFWGEKKTRKDSNQTRENGGFLCCCFFRERT
ncbi:hypothetical protein ACLOJK_014020 [Asimina triloba]